MGTQKSLLTSLGILKLLLLAIAAGLITINITTTWKRGYINLWGISVLLWIAGCYLIWKKRREINLESSTLPSLIGATLISLVFFDTICPINKFSYISPFVSALGLGLIASGFKGLKQYWQELLISFFPCGAYTTLLFLIDLPIMTAKFATFLLWYLGFQVHRQGVNIILSTGSIEVNKSCSGLDNLLQLWVISILFLVMFPTRGCRKFLIPVVASLLGFAINGMRVALMTVLVASSNQKTFDYWHQGDGSLIFSMLSVLLVGLFCMFILRVSDPGKQDFT